MRHLLFYPESMKSHFLILRDSNLCCFLCDKLRTLAAWSYQCPPIGSVCILSAPFRETIGWRSSAPSSLSLVVPQPSSAMTFSTTFHYSSRMTAAPSSPILKRSTSGESRYHWLVQDITSVSSLAEKSFPSERLKESDFSHGHRISCRSNFFPDWTRCLKIIGKQTNK